MIVLAPTPRLGDFGLELLEEIGGALFQPVKDMISLEHGEQAADVVVEAPKIVLEGVLAYELVWIPPAKIVLDGDLADDHITEQNLAVSAARHTAPHTPTRSTNRKPP